MLFVALDAPRTKNTISIPACVEYAALDADYMRNDSHSLLLIMRISRL
ncbi:hypothetical protein OAL01_01665 [Rubripirellula sp.]|nr:hypothetical protein [Rubripirellula sp.]